jgi:hypothetical protein
MIKSMEYYSGTLRITNPKTIQAWKDRGWWQAKLDEGWIYAEGCGRFKTEVCTCSACRRKEKNKSEKDVVF